MKGRSLIAEAVGPSVMSRQEPEYSQGMVETTVDTLAGVDVSYKAVHSSQPNNSLETHERSGTKARGRPSDGR